MVNHYRQLLDGESPPQFPINLDGKAGNPIVRFVKVALVAEKPVETAKGSKSIQWCFRKMCLYYIDRNRGWDPRFDTAILEKGGLLAALEEGDPVLDWPLADGEVIESKSMPSKTPRKETAESSPGGSGPAAATRSKAGKITTNFTPPPFALKTNVPSDGSYNTFDLLRFGYFVADELGVVHRRSGTVPLASEKIGSSSAGPSDLKKVNTFPIGPREMRIMRAR
ncbi:hypothetical protein Aspvir_000564 [Aspergillus viridinutans]|uniref:Uncharacterized protein n=1 Tax=Aspergillus viridinutans TaxID=75553 RepID=A0A9P3BL99_ASPVI|nr:uncharacterized protein Aspvir_000564 [Aspergillus viridinutans]GIJ98447.1 hypothetical protein Aspvir_000564 [Aspergillus viridinutans]